MQPRLKKYKEFIEKEYLNSLLWNKDHSLGGLRAGLKQKIKRGHFKRIVFCGMGCSAIVADMIKGFFVDQKTPIFIEVVNDYDLDYSINREILKDDKILFIISSFGGNSNEPVKFYEQIKKLTKNVIFLTSGGRLGKIAETQNISVIYWRLRNPNEKYSLLHAPQFFAILLDIFFELKIIKHNYQSKLSDTVRYLKKEFNQKKISEAKKMAQKFKDREVILLATPKWHLTLLKLAVMHFNEMALAPVHLNSFHEFTHCEVAVFAEPKAKLAAVIFEDNKEDQYTKNKIQNLVKVLTAKIKQNKNIELVVIKMDQDDFFKKFFSALLFIQYVVYFLAVSYNLKSREFISKIKYAKLKPCS